MHADQFFRQASQLPIAGLPEIIGTGGLVVVAPHPDDESLGCGGLIAAAATAGASVEVVVVSDGAGSHPNSKRFPQGRLRALREDETRAALRELGVGVSGSNFLGLPDRFVPTSGAAADEAVTAICSALQRSKASVVCVTWPHDPHCDHGAAATLTAAAAARCGVKVLHYPVWAGRCQRRPRSDPHPGAYGSTSRPIGPPKPRRSRRIDRR